MQRPFRFASRRSASNVPRAQAVGLVAEASEDGDARALRRTPGVMSFARKVLLSCLGIGIIGSAISGQIAPTHSSFTATTVNAGNTFAAGTLNMTNNGAAGGCTNVIASACGILNVSANAPATTVTAGVSNMLPGNVATGTVNITNAGTLPALVYVEFARVGGTAGSNAFGQCGAGCVGLTGSLNLTLHDDSRDNCLYGFTPTTGAVSYPVLGQACDTLLSATELTNNDLLTGAPTSSLTAIPGSLADTRWAPAEPHSFTVTVQMAHGAGNQFQGGSAKFDLIWIALP